MQQNLNLTHTDKPWAIIDGPSPSSVVQMVVVDKTARFLMLHRSNTVRSARNVWSLPSGMHDIGETQKECGMRELSEEFGLSGLRSRFLGIYENIAGDASADNHWHWVICLHAVFVEDLDTFVNREPDKHDQIKFPPITALCSRQFYIDNRFHTSFERFMNDNGVPLVIALARFIDNKN